MNIVYIIKAKVWVDPEDQEVLEDLLEAISAIGEYVIEDVGLEKEKEIKDAKQN